jgi:FtsP/CotA-like multicopper oxidase with cupredoxin domain
MVRINGMADHIFRPDRRALLAGLGAAVLSPASQPAVARGRPALGLRARADLLALRPGEPETPIWSLDGPDLRFRRGDSPGIAFLNDLPAPMVLDWRGIDGAKAAEPLLARSAVAPGARETFEIPLRYAGTFMCDLRLLGDGAARPARPLALVVDESEPVFVDRDEVFLVEDWRLSADGTAISPGNDPKDTLPTYTVNGRTSLDLKARVNERLRLRFINACQRSVIALKLEDLDVRVMALDGQPSEPFPARNHALVLAPGGRIDVYVDMTASPGSTSPILLHDGREARPIARLIASNDPPIRNAVLPAAAPLPSNGLPARLDLKNAVRIELPLGGSQTDWAAPSKFSASAPPAFRVKTGRTVVLTLTNRAEIAGVFHLHGHHFRLLDRLDDGWKPFWLDTLAIDAGQTQRVAFAAEYAGRWLIESVATDWAAPRLVRWYGVE